MSENQLPSVEQNVLVPLASLYPHVRNYRSHPASQIKKLKASLERWGLVRSIVAKSNDDGTYTIIAGHGIVQAAQELVEANAEYYQRFGKLRTDVIPSNWTETDTLGYLAADNHLSNEAVDDEETLAQILQEQFDAGYDLASLGSDEETLRQMLEEMGDNLLGEGEDGLVPISTEDHSVEQIQYLKFGKYSIPLTQEEVEALEHRLSAYAESTGSYYGFVRQVLHG